MSNVNIYKCKPRQARRFIIQCLEAGLVPYLRSSPGMGKSSIIKSIAQDFEFHLIDHRLSTSEPTDMTGLPKFNGEGAHFAPFTEIFPIQSTPLPKGKRAWMIFLDEFNAAKRDVQAAAYKLILDKMVGQHPLHSQALICAAGNLDTDRAIVNPLSTAMQSRVIHLEMEVDLDDWLRDVAIKYNYDSRIIAFLSAYPSKLMDFKPDHHDRTFCCPRTWEFVNRLVKDPEGNSREITDEVGILLAGAITSGVAMEFVKFTQVYQHMISTREICANPKTCRMPNELNLKWAVITQMMDQVTDKNFKDLRTYADRFDLSFRILFYRSVLIRHPELRTHPEFGPATNDLNKYLNEDSKNG